MKVLGNLNQYKLTAFINTFLRDNKNCVWFANMSDGVLFVDKTTPINNKHCYRAVYIKSVGQWTIHHMLLDKMDLEWVGYTDHEPPYFPRVAHSCMMYSGRWNKMV